MVEHRPDPDPIEAGLFARARAHLMDLTPLRTSRDFRLLFAGRAVSAVGDQLVAVAVPYEVYRLTGSTLAVGLLGLAELVPVFVLPILGGVVADAVERRRLVTVTHLALAAMSVLMAINAARPHPMLWPFYAFATVSAGLYTFIRPAMDTWPARLVPLDLLPSVSALDAGAGTLAFTVGPVIAGVLIALIGVSGVFVVDVVTFLTVIGAVLLMRPSPPSDEENDVSWGAIVEGFRFLRGKRVLQSVFLADLNAMVFGFPVALFPAIADRLGGGPATLGLLYAAPAAGAFVATLFSGRAKHVRRQGRAILVATMIWGGGIIVFGFSTALWLSLLMIAVAGSADMVSGIFRSTILQTAVEDRLRGRLDGIGMAVWATGPAVGNVESGVVASLVSVPFSVVSGGILTMVGAVAIRWFAPAFWRYDARHPSP